MSTSSLRHDRRYSRGLVVALESRKQLNADLCSHLNLATLTLLITRTGCAATAAYTTNVVSTFRDKGEAGFGLCLRLHRHQQDAIQLANHYGAVWWYAKRPILWRWEGA